MGFGRSLGLATALLAMASSGGRAQDSIPDGDWRTINRDAAATRFSPLDDINRSNVAQLQQAWEYPFRSFNTAVPLVVDGTMYFPAGNRVIALAQHRRVAQRPAQPATQFTRAHRGGRAVDDARERVLVAARKAGVELEVAPRRRVHRQRLVARLARQSRQVGQGAALRVAHVLQQRAGGAECERQVLAAKARAPRRISMSQAPRQKNFG